MKLNLIKLLNKSNKDNLLIKILIIKDNNNILSIKELKNNNQWNIIIYNYNKNNEINNIINNNIIIQLLYRIINMFNGNKLFISKPIFKHNINSIHIKYYYYIPIDNNNIIIIINNIINKLSNILSYYYNKEIIIKPIKLSYVYMDHNIFNDYIIYLLNNNNNINIDKVINNYINIFNNIIPLNIKNNNNNIKYLNGWSIILKGKLSDGRSKTYNLIYGSFNNLNKSYKLNYIPNNLYYGLINPLYLNINKEGKYNIKVKLNYYN